MRPIPVSLVVLVAWAGCTAVEPNEGIEGTVMMGPTCPVERDPPDPQCADRPLETRLVVTTADQARVVEEFASDKNGTFRVSVPPGQYAIRSAAAANTLPYCASEAPIVVEADRYTETVVHCDSGIR